MSRLKTVGIDEIHTLNNNNKLIMKLIVLQNKLKEGVNITERASGKSFSLPILGNILLRAEKNFLSLETTDLEIGVKCWVLSKTEKEGEITIPVNVLSNFVRLLPDAPLSLEAGNDWLSLETEGYKTRIKGLAATDFPILPKERGANSVLLPAAPFCQALEQVWDIAIVSSGRPEISGIFFIFQKETLKIAATDSFRLAEKTLFLKQSLAGDEGYSFILPQKTVKEIINIFGSREVAEGSRRSSNQADLKVFLGANHILVEAMMVETSHPHINLVSRLIEGEYPNYQEVIPRKFETQAIVDRNEFLKQLKLASLFSGKINEVKIKIIPQKKVVEVSSQSPETGQHQSFLSGAISGKEKEVSFNYKFLIDGLLKIKSSEVIFELSERNGEPGPGVLKPVGDSSYIYVLMPMQTS